MTVAELRKKLLEYNPSAKVYVLGHNRYHPFSLTYAGADGITKKDCLEVGIFAEALNPPAERPHTPPKRGPSQFVLLTEIALQCGFVQHKTSRGRSIPGCYHLRGYEEAVVDLSECAPERIAIFSAAVAQLSSTIELQILQAQQDERERNA